MGSTAKTSKTSIVLNPVSNPAKQRTYVTFGTRRGGTSLVAGVIRALGVDFGPIGERKNNEDVQFQNKTLDDMRSAIERRNEERDVWGWKFPHAVNYLPGLARAIRNPFFIVVYRDPVAAALSQTRLDTEASRRPPRLALHEAAAMANSNTSFAMATGRPCLLVSIEKAKDNPTALIDEIADFLYVERPEEDLRRKILEFIAPGQYKAFDDFFGSGDQGSADADPTSRVELPTRPRIGKLTHH